MDSIKFKGIDVSIKVTDIDFKEFMSKLDEKKGMKHNIIEDDYIDLSVLNTNLSRTNLTRYHYKNSQNETIYVIQQSDAQVDDVTFTFYLSDKKIEDNDVTDLINTFYNIIHNM